MGHIRHRYGKGREIRWEDGKEGGGMNGKRVVEAFWPWTMPVDSNYRHLGARGLFLLICSQYSMQMSTMMAYKSIHILPWWWYWRSSNTVSYPSYILKALVQYPRKRWHILGLNWARTLYASSVVSRELAGCSICTLVQELKRMSDWSDKKFFINKIIGKVALKVLIIY